MQDPPPGGLYLSKAGVVAPLAAVQEMSWRETKAKAVRNALVLARLVSPVADRPLLTFCHASAAMKEHIFRVRHIPVDELLANRFKLVCPFLG